MISKDVKKCVDVGSSSTIREVSRPGIGEMSVLLLRWSSGGGLVVVGRKRRDWASAIGESSLAL